MAGRGQRWGAVFVGPPSRSPSKGPPPGSLRPPPPPPLASLAGGGKRRGPHHSAGTSEVSNACLGSHLGSRSWDSAMVCQVKASRSGDSLPQPYFCSWSLYTEVITALTLW